MERSGKAVEKKDLDFSNFGVATVDEKDDLKKISGVGPFIEKKLNEIGIYTFEQVSKFSDKDIDNITELIEFFPGRILRDDWRGQSTLLKNGGETDFSKRVDNNDIDYNKDSEK
jgi:predicted flap endonuclease-1-like 5' DNA nuclease